MLSVQNKAGKSLRAIARDYGDPITYGDISRILQGVFPKNPGKRAKLNLPALLPAPVCPRCGIVHVSRRCPNHVRQWRRLDDLPPDVLRWKLEHREEL